MKKNKPKRLAMQASALLLMLCACAADAIVLDFETLADGHAAMALRSASKEYAASGVLFSGGDDYPGQPLFRQWTSLSKIVAGKPPDTNRFLITTFQQSDDDSYLDIVVSFLHPVGHVEGDLVFNPSVTATATAYDASARVLEEDSFAGGGASWVGGRFSFDSPMGIGSILLRTSIPEAQIGLDNLQFTFLAVPGPASAGWILSGLIAIALGMRRSFPQPGQAGARSGLGLGAAR